MSFINFLELGNSCLKQNFSVEKTMFPFCLSVFLSTLVLSLCQKDLICVRKFFLHVVLKERPTFPLQFITMLPNMSVNLETKILFGIVTMLLNDKKLTNT